MPPLSKPLRSHLERAVATARKLCEAAARSTLNQLGVAKPIADQFLTDAQKICTGVCGRMGAS